MSNRHRRSAGAPSREMPPGPFLAKVISHLDPKRSGALQVQLLTNTTSGQDADNEAGQLYTVDYCMPFYGVNDVSSNRKNDTYYSTQQSYGFWAVPPDPGTKVLVIFAEGQSNQGYWIGCVQDAYMNYMVPSGTPTTKSDKVVQANLTDEFKNRPLPTGEYNKAIHGDQGNDPEQFLKPHNPMMLEVLSRQGLIDDIARGLTSSTARREIPSMVFGMNTPGPLDKRDGSPKGRYGPSGEQIEYFRSRLGGSSFVMDDGDPTVLRAGFAKSVGATYYDINAVPENVSQANQTLPYNEHIRLRTRTGHQILLHNTEDLIYIANAQGSAWIELTANGKIDVYADDSISLRTANDVNVHADRDINMKAMRDVNITAGRDWKTTAGNNFDLKAGTNGKIDIGANFDLYVGATSKIFVGADGHINVAGAHSITSQTTLDVLTGVTAKFKQASMHIVSQGNTNLTAGFRTSILSGNEHRETAPAIHMNTAASPATQADEASGASTASTATPANQPIRVPEREPWNGHENLNPEGHTPGLSQARPAPSRQGRDAQSLIDLPANQPQYTSTSGPNVANQSTVIDPVTGQRVPAPQTVVPGQAGPIGRQPAEPVPVNDMQRYFLHVLIQEIGLDPATCLNPANPELLAVGQTPGNAEALASALAQIQRECGFEPHSENLNYSASRLRQVFPSRVRSDAFAQQLAAGGPAAIGNTLYGGRNGNAQDEGYKYRGRGLIQLTFKDNYRNFGGAAGHPEIVENPDLLNDPEIATAVAVAYLKETFPSRGGGNWSMYNFNQLGQAFEDAVGYGNEAAETPQRIASARGFFSRLRNGEILPLASLTPTPPVASGESTVVDERSPVRPGENT